MRGPPATRKFNFKGYATRLASAATMFYRVNFQERDAFNDAQHRLNIRFETTCCAPAFLASRASQEASWSVVVARTSVRTSNSRVAGPDCIFPGFDARVEFQDHAKLPVS
jgi:hypothetical protein